MDFEIINFGTEIMNIKIVYCKWNLCWHVYLLFHVPIVVVYVKLWICKFILRFKKIQNYLTYFNPMWNYQNFRNNGNVSLSNIPKYAQE